MHRLTHFFVSLVLLWGVAVQAQAAGDQEFPNRKLYPELSYISLDELATHYDNYIVIDVRSPFEYHTLHSQNALNIPRTDDDFAERVQQLRSQYPDKPIALYCNGKSCKQSYKAGRKCYQHKIPNVHVYDQGINDWARAHPDKSVLIGRAPVDPRKLLSEADLQAHMIDYNKFAEIANSSNTVILDVRDPLDREGVGLFVGQEQRADYRHIKQIDGILDDAQRSGKTVLIYDNAGTEVVWLMYHMIDKNISKYYFLKGGMRQYYAELLNDINVKTQ
ncbi:MAG: rhodanese-like domain-containing protein [Gammaproteobacteria bacterium]|nr:rhodanese-like domain-containing protein [Gammaproteobacteria bacterium]